MPGKFEAPRSRSWVPLVILLLVLILAGLLIIWFGKSADSPLETTLPIVTTQPLPPETTTIPTETTEPNPVVSTASIGAQGDLLMHMSVINSGKQENGDYDFSSIFRYLTDYVSRWDYAAANLETTLGGTKYPYQGNPEFNCPDALADAAVDAGYDLLLTINNHCADTHTDGLKRTLEQLRSRGLNTLGTMLSGKEEKYTIQDINGIKIGMIAYSYADNATSDGRPSFNYRDYLKEPGLANYFRETNLDAFYEEMENHIANMNADGAEAIILYIHWGQEYKIEENATQNAIAQKMCDLGIDVIIGGHPHVVQPVQLLESTTDPSHKTVCIYSLGNAVSNQRREEMRLKTGHTEDGALFSVVFEKYADGTVRLADVDVLPTWVNMHSHNGKKEYNILPLDKETEDAWMSLYAMTEAEFAEAQKSYQRTMDIVSEGLNQCWEYLAQLS